MRMSIKKLLTVAGFSLGASLMSGQSAEAAGSFSPTFTVTASVNSSCTFDSITGISFGPYVTSADTDAAGQLSVDCSAGSSVIVTLNDGSNGTGTAAAPFRRMIDPLSATPLHYALYSDAARTLQWGADAANDVAITNLPAGVTSIPIYGRIPQGQTVLSGTGYTDTVTASVSY
jgi:spore coat protein U-like protein